MIYKFFTNTTTTLLQQHGETYYILNDNKKGLRKDHNSTTRQIQMILAALEDAKLTHQGIYILYIDFNNAFGSINHLRLLAIMEDLGYLTNEVSLIGIIYTKASTTFISPTLAIPNPYP